MKKWMKVMPVIFVMLLCILAFPQKANAAQVSLSVGDTTIVTLPDNVELDLAKPEGINKQFYYTGNYSNYSPNKWR